MPVVLRKRKAPAPTPPQAAPAPTPKKQKMIQTASKAGKDSAAKAAAKSQLSELEAQPTTPAAGRKKTPPPKPAPAASKKTTKKGASAPKKKASSPASSSSLTAPPSPSASPPVKSSGKPELGQRLELDGFGSEVQLNDGTPTTLKALVDASQAGVAIFTYPRASTPGCTNQACLFRDSYAPLTAGGLAIYGLSTDSTKANSTFQQKQNLPYPLICDPQATLISALGLKKSPKGTQRGVFVVAKDGKVLALQPGGPAATVDVVRGVVAEMGAGDANKAAAAAATEGDKETAEGDTRAKEGGGKEDGARQEEESVAKVEAKDDAETEEDSAALAPEAKVEMHTKKKAAKKDSSKKDEPKKGSRRTKAKASASKEDQETEVQEKGV